MSLITLTDAEPENDAVLEASPPTAIARTFWNVAATTATPENGVVSPADLPVRAASVPEAPRP